MIWKDVWLEILNELRLGESERVLVGNCDGEVLGGAYGGLVGRSEKGCRSGKTGVLRLGECSDWVPGGLSGLQDAQRCQNQGCWLIRTKTPVLKDEICCWMYTINPSKHHQTMSMRVQSVTPTVYMAMALLERIECITTSSKVNLILATPTQQVLALGTDNVQGTDRAEPLAGSWIVFDRGVGWSPVLPHLEEEINARSDCTGHRGL